MLGYDGLERRLTMEVMIVYYAMIFAVNFVKYRTKQPEICSWAGMAKGKRRMVPGTVKSVSKIFGRF